MSQNNQGQIGDLQFKTLSRKGDQIIDANGNLKVKNATVKNLKVKGTLTATDPAIGIWVGVAPVPTPQYIQFQLYPGGNLEFNSSIDVGQAYSIAPYGGALTAGLGYWKNLGNGQYQTRQTQLIMDKDLTPGNEHVMIPNTRIVVDGTFTLANNAQNLNGQFVVNGYAINDINFQNILYTVPSRPYNCGRLPSI